MPGEALLIGIATIAVVVAGFAAIAPGLASDRAGWTVGQRFRLRGIVSTSFNVTFESLLPAVLFPALDDARTTIILSSAIVFVYALFVISVRLRQLIRSGVPWVRWTRFVVASGFTATAPLRPERSGLRVPHRVRARTVHPTVRGRHQLLYSLAAGAE